MGNAIKAVANKTIDFFKKIGRIIKKAVEVVVNGVKKIVNYFKKIIEYAYNGVKIVGKLIVAQGRKLINTLTFKKGIPYLINFFIELIKKKVNLIDENDNKIDPYDFFINFGKQMDENDQIKVKVEAPNIDKSQDDAVFDFGEKNSKDLNYFPGLKEEEPIAKIGEKEISLDNISNISNISKNNSDDDEEDEFNYL